VDFLKQYSFLVDLANMILRDPISGSSWGFLNCKSVCNVVLLRPFLASDNYTKMLQEFPDMTLLLIRISPLNMI